MPEKVTVTVKGGKVCGFKTKTAYSGKEYYTFFGIPYGQSTAGAARFKDPVKAKPWTDILDATIEKGGCKQFSLQERRITGTEDCLYNNIYTSELPSRGKNALRAVMVNIHPGAFANGSPDRSRYGAPDFIIHQEVVYVCISFRLHLLGSLNLHMKECSGNQGLKDIILGLQWIQENISVFGGDPSNVTVMGSSTGAGLVHLLLLSPLAKGLYHKAIIMGCYAYIPHIILPRENSSIAYEFARQMGYDGPPTDFKKLLNFFKKLDLHSLFMIRPDRFYSKTKLQVYPMSPMFLNPEPRENSPLPVSLEKLIPSTNPVPVIIGFCEREACMALALIRTFKVSISECFRTLMGQNEFGWGAALNDEELKLIQKEVEDYYLNGQSLDTASQSVLCDILTDIALSDVYDSLINVIASQLPSSVYVYNFHYDGKLCSMKARVGPLLGEKLDGAFHGADYSYWCYSEETAGKTMKNIHPEDRKTIDRLTNLLTTFAKTSDPNYEGLEVYWKPTTPDHPSHLIINETLNVKDELLNGERMQFWHNLKSKYKKEKYSI